MYFGGFVSMCLIVFTCQTSCRRWTKADLCFWTGLHEVSEKQRNLYEQLTGRPSVVRALTAQLIPRVLSLELQGLDAFCFRPPYSRCKIQDSWVLRRSWMKVGAGEDERSFFGILNLWCMTLKFLIIHFCSSAGPFRQCWVFWSFILCIKINLFAGRISFSNVSV